MDLLVQAPYFYEVGNKLNEMWERSPDFSEFLVKTFRTRYYELISKVRHPGLCNLCNHHA